MKKLLPVLLMLLLAVGGCKKEQSAATKPAVTITGISPAAVSSGTVVTITGTNFGTDTTGAKVLFNGVAGMVQSVNPTQIEAVVPVTTSGNVTVTIGNQTITGPAFTYTIPQVTITGISPAAGTSGTIVTITGTNFNLTASGIKVEFNGVAATILSFSLTEIKVAVPVTTSGNITLSISGQTIQGPVFTYVIPTVTGISPATGSAGTVVTITGTNFGTSATGVKVLFNGAAGTVQSVSATEIKIVAPVATSGSVTINIDGQSITGPMFIYSLPLNTPYTNGDVRLTTQAEVDAFTALNKGRQLQITGGLSISGNDITSVSGLSNVTSVSGILSIGACPLLTDVSFLNNITSAGSINLQTQAVAAITADKLTGTTGYIYLFSCKNLNSISFKLLTGITSNTIIGGLRITSCEQLSKVDFSSLSSSAGTFMITGTAISNFSGFNALQTAGSLSVSNNPALTDFQGLERLTALTLPATTPTFGGTAINGIYINNNAKLTSLSGLQNLKTVPIARMLTNAMLNDFCPLKTIINTLSKLPAYSYRNLNSSTGSTSVAALTMTNNGNFPTAQKALEAVALCN